MSTRRIIFMLFSLLILGLLMVFFNYMSKVDEIGKPVTRRVQITSQDEQESIYIKLKSWGLTGDHQVITVSQNPDENQDPNPSNEYIFEGLLPFFYERNQDTVRIYVRKKSNVPPEFNSVFTVEQIELSNPEMMSLYDSYQEKGLKKLSN